MRFFFFDRILELEPGNRARAVKSISLTEEYLPAHFGKVAVMPATLVFESIAQVGGWLHVVSREFKPKTLLVLIEGGRVHRQLRPGDTMELEAWLDFEHSDGSTMHGQARVDGEVVAVVDRIVFGSEISSDPAYAESQRELFAYVCGGRDHTRR